MAVEWCDLYSKCKHFSIHYDNSDIFDHGSITFYCNKSGIMKEIPHCICKKCDIMAEMLKGVNNGKEI